MKNLLLALVVVGLLGGCSMFKPKKTETKSQNEPAATTPAPVAEAATVGSATTADVNAQALANNAATTAPAATAEDANKPAQASDVAVTPPKHSVYFPFDVDAIQDADKEIIQAHGAYLGEHPERKARVEGNADERGSSEYNLALGQRRANNTKKALVLSGAKANQIEAISYGEEKPVATGHDEASWAQNRRADINY